MIHYIEDHLKTWASIIGSLAVLIACKRWVFSLGRWVANAYTRPARIEAMIGRMEYAIFNQGNGMEKKIARLAACHDVAFEAASYPAFECDGNGRNARSNEAYRTLTQTRSEDPLNGTRWYQVAYGPLAEAYHKEFARCSLTKGDFVGVCDFKNPMTDEHRGRWRIHAPCAQIGDECIYVGRFIAALDDTAKQIVMEEGWSVRLG
jgi:PAS domain-containing protein